MITANKSFVLFLGLLCNGILQGLDHEVQPCSSPMEKNAMCIGMIGLPIGVGLAALCGIKNMLGLMAGASALVAGSIGIYGTRNASAGDIFRYGVITTALTTFAACLGSMGRGGF